MIYRLSFALFMCFQQLVFCQLTIGLQSGGVLYTGDLSPDNISKNTKIIRPFIGGYLRLNNNGVFSLKTGFNYGQIWGDDFFTPERDRALYFASNLIEAGISAEWNILSLKSLPLTPYIGGGFLVFNYNPKRRIRGQWVSLQELETEGQGLPDRLAPYDLTQPAISLEIGMKYAISDKWNLGIAFSYRFLFTDYLDDVGNQGVVLQEILDTKGLDAAFASKPNYDPFSENLSESFIRGAAGNDAYFLIGLQLGYHINDGPHLGYSEGRKGRRARNVSTVRCYKF